MPLTIGDIGRKKVCYIIVGVISSTHDWKNRFNYILKIPKKACDIVKKPFLFLVSAGVILLVLVSGCTSDISTKAGVGTFGGSSDPAVSRSATPVNIATPFPGTTLTYRAGSSFTCDYDENLLKTSPDFSGWFNASCHYNDYCGWWESNDLLPKLTPTTECINCSAESMMALVTPTPAPTVCPVRTQKTDGSIPPVITVTTASPASGACSFGLTECRVFSTDYCVDLLTDVAHCGACRWHCPLPNAVNGCRDGKCYIKSCTIGWADCNGLAEDGCEVDLDSDDNNCGKCGRICSLPNAGHAICAGEDGNGICQVEYCADGWVNRNGLHEDGCESLQ
jgi:hypothetical protein